jgi:hypothetical protein
VLILAIGGILLLLLALPFTIMRIGPSIDSVRENYARVDHERRCELNRADCFNLGIHADHVTTDSEMLTKLLLACVPLIATGVILLKHSYKDLAKRPLKLV